MRLIGKLFSIPVTLLNRIGLWTLKLLRIPPPGEDSRLYSLDELELLVSESYAEGLFEDDEQELVTNLLDFAEERVDQVMMPRPMMTAIPAHRHRRGGTAVAVCIHALQPAAGVWREHRRHSSELCISRTWYASSLRRSPSSWHRLLRPVSFVPETLPVKTLLAEFQRTAPADRHRHR